MNQKSSRRPAKGANKRPGPAKSKSRVGARPVRGGGQGGPRPANRSNRSKRVQRGLGGQQVEGRHAVRELLLAGRRRVSEVFIANDLDQADIVDDIIHLAHELGVRVLPVGRSRITSEAATTSHQGVVARAAPIPEHTLADLTAVENPFLLVLDGVTDPQNLGALLRTAETAGVTGVVMSRHRSVHITPTVTKTAAGAVEYLPMAVVGGIPNALGHLSEAGVVTLGLDGSGSRSIFDLSARDVGSVALVLGDEGRGLSKLVRQRVDSLLAIPLGGELNSLNVAAASAVACFEVVRVRKASARNEPTI